jgi:hypothetical protein
MNRYVTVAKNGTDIVIAEVSHGFASWEKIRSLSQPLQGAALRDELETVAKEYDAEVCNSLDAIEDAIAKLSISLESANK